MQQQSKYLILATTLSYAWMQQFFFILLSHTATRRQPISVTNPFFHPAHVLYRPHAFWASVGMLDLWRQDLTQNLTSRTSASALVIERLVASLGWLSGWLSRCVGSGSAQLQTRSLRG
ncbi:hypothetical protein PMIN05_005510 [Paraphaeosphaeria minitans]